MSRILDAAEAEFMRCGYERAIIDRMLASFGGSKATVFRHFPSKRALFEGVIRRTAQRWEALVHWKDIDLVDPQCWLTEFSSRVLVWLLSPEPMFLGRAAVAEGHTFPDLRELFSELALRPIEALISAKLKTWTCEGLLRVDNADDVARVIMDTLFIGAVARELLSGRDQTDSLGDLRYVEDRVRLIVAALNVR